MPLTLKASPTNCINPWRNKKRVNDFFSHNYFVLWVSKKAFYNHVFIDFGIRRSNICQWLPVWNRSDNSQRALMFGFWKLYFEIGYKF